MSNAPSQDSIHFGSFRLDTVNERLWRGRRTIALKPKAFAVLRYLLEHPNRLVSKNELLDAVWPDAIVSEGVLKFCIREIRRALGDKPQAPCFIETLHRRGYRWLASLRSASPVPSSRFKVQSQRTSSKIKGQKPVLSPSTLLRINFVEGAEVKNC